MASGLIVLTFVKTKVIITICVREALDIKFIHYVIAADG